MASAEAKNRYRRKRSNKQKAWEYMRRNKTFRVGDIMMLLGVSQTYMKTMCWALEHAGYLKLVADEGRYPDRVYRLVRDTGVKSPSVINGEVYDYNTREFFDAPKREKRPPRPSMAPRALIAMLGAMTSPEMTKEEICMRAGVSTGGGGVKMNFSMLQKRGVLARTAPLRRRNGKMLFRIDTAAASAMRDTLIREAGIEAEYARKED